ncbi:translation initiation factor IF-2 N-terminal domain-containing protein [Desulfotignum phosphitoxidans]|uniref:Putative NTPase, NACHT domain-containing protein n=1 Tax=Desulfotignum phosphitoxidans DSM 13687 TaxID=1286635 RepID=S0FYZ2_9BACT|nr:translation initiation factor IF-2 N-terminal domain-containing protein [Desulfotignum phosphitoxidans]EMS79880.1 putative NTPase, NACHT domain-containing protein [Desulfotignum phosphitoxidans DSM 13687]
MTKIRVYELARDLNMTNKALLDKLEELCIEGKGHLSSLEYTEVKQIKRNIFGKTHKESLDTLVKPSVIRRRIPIIPDWEIFEKEVRNLLTQQGWAVTPEHILGPKKVDAYAEKTTDFMQKKKIAIECKYYEKPLSKSEVVTIVVDYLPLIQNNYVDTLLIVTSNGLSPAAVTYAKDTEGIVHIKFLELLYSSIDFSNYVQGIRAQYTMDELPVLYTYQSAKDIENSHILDVAEHILDWTESEDEQPLAIFGGYGIGKSTLAKRLAYVLAKRHMLDSQKRIPIMIGLDDVTSDQSLDGLLGRHFTSFATVPNFNFHIFLQLNNRGRFVIILDGFDEMKKTMSWESLQYNFTQFNKLIGKNTKVILLGRPTAFISEAEYIEAIQGKRSIGGTLKQIPGWPEYKEYRLLRFELKQIKEYVQKYKTTKIFQGQKPHQINRFYNILERYKKHKLLDLASRPVQLKMLLQILPHYKGSLDIFTETILYSEFVELIIRRDLKKRARSAYNLKERRLFASKLAFWMWQNDATLEISVSSIPDDIFKGFERKDVHIDAVKRDLISGCFLEKKPPEGLYLPHRSFLEFLVADWLVRLVERKDENLLEIPFVSPEIIAFFNELVGKKNVLEWRDWLRRISKNRAIEEQCVELFKETCKYYNIRVTSTLLNELRHIKPQKKKENSIDELKASEDLDNYPIKKRKQKKMPHRLGGVTKKKNLRGVKC